MGSVEGAGAISIAVVAHFKYTGEYAQAKFGSNPEVKWQNHMCLSQGEEVVRQTQEKHGLFAIPQGVLDAEGIFLHTPMLEIDVA